MRELKFRAWQPAHKKMSTNVNLYQMGRPYVVKAQVDNGSFMLPVGSAAIIMQAIGFADNNGIDIYEGDIISLDVESESSSDPTKTEPDWILAEVRWNHAGFVAWIKADDGDVTCDIPHDTLVMGNIYQNPELLES